MAETSRIEDERPAPRVAVQGPTKLQQSSGKWTWLLEWGGDQRKTFYLCAIILGFCYFILSVYLKMGWDEYSGESPGHPAPFGDFFALWSYAKIASAYPVAELYDSAVLHVRQVALGMAANGQNPFPYPPTFVFLLWPFHLLPLEAAYLVWTAGTLLLFVGAVWATCSRLPVCVLGAIVAPVCVANISSGQSGFLAATLIILGVRLAGSRPILAGLLIGFLSYKPQLGFLVPIALASARYWTAFSAACATVIALAIGATFAFGWAVWPAWLAMLPAYNELYDQSMVGSKIILMASVTANLQMMGVAPSVAKGVEFFAAITVAVIIWNCFRRGSTRLATAALLVGTFLATPHAGVYDMPMIAAGQALLIDARMQSNPTFSLAEVLILLLSTFFPVFMFLKVVNFPFSTVPLLLLFGLILWHEKHPPSRSPGRILPLGSDTAAHAAARSDIAPA